MPIQAGCRVQGLVRFQVLVLAPDQVLVLAPDQVQGVKRESARLVQVLAQVLARVR